MPLYAWTLEWDYDIAFRVDDWRYKSSFGYLRLAHAW